MNPIYAARKARIKAESQWRMIDRDPSSTPEQRTEARTAYEMAKKQYLAAFKQQRQTEAAAIAQLNGGAA